MSNLYRRPSKDASYQVLIHLARQFQRRRFFRNQPIRNKNCLWWPCLLMDRDKLRSLYKGPSIDASNQVSVHLAEEFQRRRLKCDKLKDDGRQVMAKAHVAFGKVS
jgi:predicted aminopeptidase